MVRLLVLRVTGDLRTWSTSFHLLLVMKEFSFWQWATCPQRLSNRSYGGCWRGWSGWYCRRWWNPVCSCAWNNRLRVFIYRTLFVYELLYSSRPDLFRWKISIALMSSAHHLVLGGHVLTASQMFCTFWWVMLDHWSLCAMLNLISGKHRQYKRSRLQQCQVLFL